MEDPTIDLIKNWTREYRKDKLKHERVDCPLCNKNISIKIINAHLKTIKHKNFLNAYIEKKIKEDIEFNTIIFDD